MNGLYNGHTGESHRARIPNFSNVIINESCELNECKFQMNMQHGYFQKTLTNGDNYRVIQQIYAHRFYTRAIINTITIERINQQGPINVNLQLDAGNTDSVDLTLLTNVSSNVNNIDVVINCYVTKVVEDPVYQPLLSSVCVLHSIVPQSLTMSGNSLSFDHLTIVGKTDEEVLKEFLDITSINMNDVFNNHTAVWEDCWNRFEISVIENPYVNSVIHSSLFYLFSSLPSEHSNQPNGQFYGLSPGGLPRTSFQGHSFWDTEMWMHAPILMLNPKWSEHILSYRYNSRKAAANNAKATGFEGYRFPWESAFTGRKVTPVCCPQNEDYQLHVISDIAFAFKNHLSATHDVDWWQSVGCDIAYNTAKFWESKAEFNSTTKMYDIRGKKSFKLIR
jgi:trehalose/maltose hydrolase-like predicted phosphorylase